jgi:hypothetical protein
VIEIGHGCPPGSSKCLPEKIKTVVDGVGATELLGGNDTQSIPAAKNNAVRPTSPNQTREVGQQAGRWKL